MKTIRIVLVLVLALLAAGLPQRLAGAQGPLPLSAFPRPPSDNGLGVHWSTYIYGQPDDVTDYFVGELRAMGVRWVKFLNDGTEGRHNDYLVEQLVRNGIMPVMRIYFKCNGPLDGASLQRMVEHYQARGVYYYELFNEPELPDEAGGWCDGETPDAERLLDYWIPAAHVIQQAGAFLAVPSIFPPSLKDPAWRDSMFMRFFEGLKQRGETALLYRSWGAIHNYFLNHPVDYPYDEANLTSRALTAEEVTAWELGPGEVETINEARARARLPREEGGFYVSDNIDDDNNCFLSFLAYRNRFYELFGFEIPLISTEGGVTVGSSEDPRYPRVSESIMAQRTVQAFEYMLDQAPAYYFATSSWLLAEQALGRPNSPWEGWAWYHDLKGDHLPVVEALKTHPRRNEARAGTSSPPVATNAPASAPLVTRPVASASPAPVLTTLQTPSVPAPVDAGLGRFPRPKGDNGRGIHWTPTLHAQPTDVVDRFVAEISSMGIKWVKIIQADQPKVEHEYLIRELVRRDIMPVLRVYRAENTPYEHLEILVSQAVPLGVPYFELYNEPNIAGSPGGWRPDQQASPEAIAALWLPAAQAVLRGGGLPGTPAPTPGGDLEDLSFLRAFLRRVGAMPGGRETLQQSWIALHNYFLNHPLNYPEDDVNLHSLPLSAAEIARRGLSDAEVQAINDARAHSRLPRAQGGYYVGDTIHEDSNAFRKFEAYDKVVREAAGLTMPIISTEGGAIPGTQEDPRYPRVADDDVAQWTVGAYTYMANEAPSYYFAFTPWLVANLAAGGSDMAWEAAAWFQGPAGEAKPVVEAVRRLRTGTRAPAQPAAPAAQPAVAPSRPGTHVPVAGATQEVRVLGWLVFWADGQVQQCQHVILDSTVPMLANWRPPADGRAWGLDLRDAAGMRLKTVGQPGQLANGLPAQCTIERGATATPVPMPTPTREPHREWDRRLDPLGVSLQPAAPVAGTSYWRLTSAVYEDRQQSGGRHHVYVLLLDEGGRAVNGTVEVSWPDGSVRLSGQSKNDGDPYSKYAINFPMYGPIGSYSVRVDGASDIVTGLGMPGGLHVNFLLAFQRTRVP